MGQVVSEESVVVCWMEKAVNPGAHLKEELQNGLRKCPESIWLECDAVFPAEAQQLWPTP